MTKFNLTFRGKILAGHDREQVKSQLAELFAIDDPARLRKCFSGDLVILRRDLNRKDAAEFYSRLRRMGIETELVKIEERNGAQHSKTPGSNPQADAKSSAAEQDRVKAQAREAAHKAKLEASHQAKLEAARKKTELAEQKRQAAAEVARRKAEERRRKEEKKAQRAAEHERARAAEAARLEAERAARAEERARLEELQRQRRAEQQRLAAEKADRREAQRREQEQKAAQVKLENARRKRQQAAAAAQRKAEELRKRAEEKALAEAAEREQQAQRQAMEEQAERRAAQELTHISPPPAGGRVKTRLELPNRTRASQTDAYAGRRKRLPGEPNLFSLTPFRNTSEVRQRAQLARRRMRRATAAAAISLVCCLAIGLQLSRSAPDVIIASGASEVAINPQQGPLLLAADQLLLHDRAGVGESVLEQRQLGVQGLRPPLAFGPDGTLLAPGRLAGSAAHSARDKLPPTLLRCQLDELECEVFSPQLAGTTISGLVVHPLDGSVFVADSVAGELLKLDSQGELLARSQVPLPPRPVLRLDAGLLHINSALGPAIAVLRYENDAFGEQLDEVLVLPSPDEASHYTAVKDFLHNGEQWWVILERGDRAPVVFRFDEQWNVLGRAQLPPGVAPAQLAAWGGRVLVRDPDRIALSKFNAQGAGEAPLVSGLLNELIAQRQRRESLELLAWRTGLALSVLALLASCCLAGLYRNRALVYTSSREQGAEPLEQQSHEIAWLAPASNRQQRILLLARTYGALVLAGILLAIGLGVSALQLSALLLALAGPATALLLLHRSEPGHIGTSGDTLVLADHQGMYHLGSGSRVHYRGHFLMIDDVTIFIGSRLLPVFDPAGIVTQVVPLARRGICVDRSFLTVRLLQGRHPLALGAAAILACGCGALALLSLPGLG